MLLNNTCPGLGDKRRAPFWQPGSFLGQKLVPSKRRGLLQPAGMGVAGVSKSPAGTPRFHWLLIFEGHVPILLDG